MSCFMRAATIVSWVCHIRASFSTSEQPVCLRAPSPAEFPDVSYTFQGNCAKSNINLIVKARQVRHVPSWPPTWRLVRQVGRYPGRGLRSCIMKPLTMLLGLPLLFGLSTAFAADSPSRVSQATFASSSQDPRGSHCVVQLKPVGPREKVSWTKALGCFPTFAEAIKAAIGVNIRPNTTPGTITSAQAKSAQATIIGIEFDQPSFGGTTLTWFTDNPAVCNGYYYFSDTTFPIRSTRAYNGCSYNYNYALPQRQGYVQICTPDCPTMTYTTQSKLWSSVPH